MFGALMASYLLQPPSFSQLLADELSCGDSLLVERRLRLIKANDAVAVQLALIEEAARPRLAAMALVTNRPRGEQRFGIVLLG
jgi:hypothetical protein